MDLGHERIAYIGKSTISSSINRLQGLRDSFGARGLACDESLIIVAEHASVNDGYDMTKQLLGRENPPTAIFVSSDTMAIGTLNAVSDMGLSVPGDVSVVGFDDIPISRFLNPALTTIRQPAYEKGHRAAEIFVDYLEAGVPMKSEILETEIIVRKSTAARL
jgi:LacI family transcriptional regulator